MPEAKRRLTFAEKYRQDLILKFCGPRPVGEPTTAPDGLIRMVCTSDTHTTTPHIPPGDLFVHAGDLTQTGTLEQLQAQLDWIGALPHKHKVIIGGNHDLLLDRQYSGPLRTDENVDDLLWHDITYLQNSSVTLEFPQLERTLTIFGSPYTPKHGDGAFAYPPKSDFWHNAIPADTDVLLCHGPPLGHLDEGKGCPHLLREVRRARPTAVVFGHIHEARGAQSYWPDHPATLAVDRVWAGHIPGVWETVATVARSVLRKGHRDSTNGVPDGATLLVNASSVDSRRGGGDGNGMVVYL